MITIKITCSMCGKSTDDMDRELMVETVDQLELNKFKARLKRIGWIVQINGWNIDTYCSKECAK